MFDNSIEREERIQPGDVVRHFKYETLSEEDKKANKYIYKVIGFAKHTETFEPLVIYQAMYRDNEKGIEIGDMFARPYVMFMSEVDKVKYPDIKQRYRFETIHRY